MKSTTDREKSPILLFDTKTNIGNYSHIIEINVYILQNNTH